MNELLMWTEYTGQEIMDWVSNNPKSPISRDILRKYYELNEDTGDVKCNINPTRKYKISDYMARWSDGWGAYTRVTYKMMKVYIDQPRRSSLKRRDE